MKSFTFLLGIFLLPLPSLTTHAQNEEATRPIKFARQPALSPDGLRLAFCYLGDIWTSNA
ncbi:MAG: hypothetical protein H7308_04585, partial [Chthonomonadaceae bacterium]|nr:hypothetical protein [Chthonomonadaceae bacterium]